MRRPLVYWFAAFVSGLILSRYLNGSLCIYVLFALGAVAAFFLVKGTKTSVALCLIVPFAAFGFLYPSLGGEESQPYPWESDTFYTISGTVSGFPNGGEDSITVDFTTATVNRESVVVKTSLILPTDTDLDYGDLLTIEATPLLNSQPSNPGGFDYSAYLEDKGIEVTLSTLYNGEVEVVGEGKVNPILQLGYFLREKFLKSLDYLAPESGQIIAGLFLGDTGGLSQDTLDVLSQTGIRHAFCVSGLHVGFVVLFIHLIAGVFSLSSGRKLLFLVPFLVVYCAVTGFYPPVCRAALMGTALYTALALGRPGDGFSGLAIAGFILLLYRPENLWLVGFQLSFTAMFSILYFLPWLENVVIKDFPGKTPLLVTIAAQILMVPLIGYYFHTVSLISLFINTICSVLVGGVVVLSLVALVFSIFSSALGAVPLVAAGVIAQGIIKGAAAVTNLPFAYFYAGAIPLWWLLATFALVIVVPRVKALGYRPVVASLTVAAILLTAVFPWGTLFRPKELEVTFLSVGEGDCAYISTPEGGNILIDAGENSGGSLAVNVIRPFLLSQGVNTLDYIFISHGDTDHAGSLPYLTKFFNVETTVFTKAGYYYTDDYEATAAANGAEVVTVETDDEFTIDGVDFKVLYPDKEELGDANALSMVLLATYGDFSLLFTGDAESETIEQVIAENNLNVDVIKVPHHGSKTGYSPDVYELLGDTLKAAVISVGENDHGHPYYLLLNDLVTRDIPIFRTDIDGAVTITTPPTGKTFTIETYLSKKNTTFP